MVLALGQEVSVLDSIQLLLQLSLQVPSAHVVLSEPASRPSSHPHVRQLRHDDDDNEEATNQDPIMGFSVARVVSLGVTRATSAAQVVVVAAMVQVHSTPAVSVEACAIPPSNHLPAAAIQAPATQASGVI